MTFLISLDELRRSTEAGPSRLPAVLPSEPQSEVRGPSTPRRRTKHPIELLTPTATPSSGKRHVKGSPTKSKDCQAASPKAFALPAEDAHGAMRRLVKQIKSARRIVVVSGAGVSTAASIPDFRSAAGLFKDKSKGKGRARGENMRDLFSVGCLSDDTLLPLHQELINDLCDMAFNAEPTPFHRLLQELDSEGRLLRCYTQNIDGLEAKVGLTVGVPEDDSATRTPKRRKTSPSSTPIQQHRATGRPLNRSGVVDLNAMRDYELAMGIVLPPTPPEEPLPLPLPTIYSSAPRVIPLHGQLDHLYCIVCFATFPTRDHLPLPLGPIACPKCAATSALRRAMSERQRSVGCLRAGVVLYGEEHPAGEAIGRVIERDLKGSGRKGEKEGKVDFLLVAGTSLTIPGVKRMIKEMAKSLHPSPHKGEKARSTVPRVVFVNDEPPRGSDWAGVFDLWVQGDIQEFVRLLDDPALAPSLEDLARPLAATPRKRKTAPEYITPPSTRIPSRKRLRREASEDYTPTKIAGIVPTWYPTPSATPSTRTSAGSVASRDSPELTPVPDDWVPLSPTPPPALDLPPSLEAENPFIGDEDACIIPPEGFRARLRASTLRASAHAPARSISPAKRLARPLDTTARPPADSSTADAATESSLVETPNAPATDAKAERFTLRINTRLCTITVKRTAQP